jgi:hypothetical protein
LKKTNKQMKKNFKSLLTIALVVGLGYAANAQQTVSAVNTTVINTNVTANAEILSALSLTKDTDINFGTLSATTPGAVFLDPKGVANENTGVTTSVGKFILLGSHGADVKVSWPATIELSDSDEDEPNTIIYELLVNGLSVDTPEDSDALGEQGVATTANVDLDEATGYYFLYVGGGFEPLTGLVRPGTYSGIANFTVEYN